MPPKRQQPTRKQRVEWVWKPIEDLDWSRKKRADMTPIEQEFVEAAVLDGEGTCVPSVERLKFLLADNPSIIETAGAAALSASFARRDSDDVVRFLVDNGARFEYPEGAFSPVHEAAWSSSHSSLSESQRRKGTEKFRLIFEAGLSDAAQIGIEPVHAMTSSHPFCTSPPPSAIPHSPTCSYSTERARSSRRGSTTTPTPLSIEQHRSATGGTGGERSQRYCSHTGRTTTSSPPAPSTTMKESGRFSWKTLLPLTPVTPTRRLPSTGLRRLEPLHAPKRSLPMASTPTPSTPARRRRSTRLPHPSARCPSTGRTLPLTRLLLSWLITARTPTRRTTRDAPPCTSRLTEVTRTPPSSS